MIDLKVSFPKDLTKRIEKELKKQTGDGLKEAAGLACQKAATSTFPIGVSGATKRILEGAINKDVNRAYIISGRVKEHENGQYLLRHRLPNGRVPSTLERKPINRQNYEELRKKFLMTAGMVKAGFMQCSVQLKSTRVPAWLKKSKSLGSVSIHKNRIVATNHVSYASDLISEASLMKIMKFTVSGLTKRLDKMKLK